MVFIHGRGLGPLVCPPHPHINLLPPPPKNESPTYTDRGVVFNVYIYRFNNISQFFSALLLASFEVASNCRKTTVQNWLSKSKPSFEEIQSIYIYIYGNTKTKSLVEEKYRIGLYMAFLFCCMIYLQYELSVGHVFLPLGNAQTRYDRMSLRICCFPEIVGSVTITT